jgi:hypothetical protein
LEGSKTNQLLDVLEKEEVYLQRYHHRLQYRQTFRNINEVGQGTTLLRQGAAQYYPQATKLSQVLRLQRLQQ